MGITKKQFEEYKKHRRQKSPSQDGGMFDDLAELEEMWIREIVRDEVKKCLKGK